MQLEHLSLRSWEQSINKLMFNIQQALPHSDLSFFSVEVVTMSQVWSGISSIINRIAVQNNNNIQDGFALMIQLGRVLGGWSWVGWVGNKPTTFIQLTVAGSISLELLQ